MAEPAKQTIYVATYFWDPKDQVSFNQKETKYFKKEKDAENWLVYMFQKHQNEKFINELREFEKVRSTVTDTNLSDFIERYNEYRARFSAMLAKWTNADYYTIESYVYIPHRAATETQPYRFHVSLKHKELH